MKIPKKFPGIKQMTVMLGIYTAVWISLEGKLWQVILLGIWVTILSSVYLFQHFLGGKQVSTSNWLILMSILGIISGTGTGFFTLIFMIIKTGLHAHGPEFNIEEIDWVTEQILFWTIAGFLGGLGVGLLLKAIFDGTSKEEIERLNS